jgi:hypothetical protein
MPEVTTSEYMTRKYEILSVGDNNLDLSPPPLRHVPRQASRYLPAILAVMPGAGHVSPKEGINKTKSVRIAVGHTHNIPCSE